MELTAPAQIAQVPDQTGSIRRKWSMHAHNKCHTDSNRSQAHTVGTVIDQFDFWVTLEPRFHSKMGSLKMRSSTQEGHIYPQ